MASASIETTKYPGWPEIISLEDSLKQEHIKQVFDKYSLEELQQRLPVNKEAQDGES